MENVRVTVFLAAATFLVNSDLHAQTHPAVTLQPSNASTFDVAAQIGWAGNVFRRESDGDDWYHTASLDLSAGHYWTPHLKVEIEVATTTEGETYRYETISVPGDNFPYFRTRNHHFRSTRASGSLVYQFLENRWFHPFVAAGLDVVRVREHVDTSQQGPPPRSAVATVPTLPAFTSVTYIGRPSVGGGFKAYMSERAFIRTDVRGSLSSNGIESLVWRAGVGVDF